MVHEEASARMGPRGELSSHPGRRRRAGWRSLALLFLLGTIAGRTEAQTGEQAPPTPSVPEPYRVRVELALVQATVRDRDGEFVRGLAQKDFRILEDGKPRELVVFSEGLEGPVRIAFLLDTSGSMRLQGRMKMARSAIRDVLERLDPDDEAALFAFADGEVEVLAGFTRERQVLSDALLGREGDGQTALIDAVASTPDLVPPRGNQKAAIVLLTDGVDNVSRLTVDQAVAIARRTDVPFYSIGLLDRSERRRRAEGATVLERFSRETGGTAFFAEDAFEVHNSVRRVVEELKQAYVLGYYPSSAPGPHTLEVLASCGKCKVTARQGVYAETAAGSGEPAPSGP